MSNVAWYDQYKVSVPDGEGGPWRVERFEVPQFSIEGLRQAVIGRDVPPGIYTRLMHSGVYPSLMMSDTPAEIRDHLRFIDRATGRVLIHGLGLGVCLQAVLRKSDVTHVDVVEIDSDVIALVGPSYPDPRVTIIEADALTYQFPSGTIWDVAWHDIWPSICSDHLPEMARLNRRYGHRITWQGGWAQREARRQA